MGVGGSQAFGGALREELGSSGLCVGAQVGMGGLKPVCGALCWELGGSGLCVGL